MRQTIHEQLFKIKSSPEKKALSVAYGIFWGIFPLWGFQLAIGLPTAAIMRLNVPLVFFAANISIPPMIPFILYASFWTGALVLGQNIGNLSLSELDNLDVIKNNVQQYTIGAVTLSIVAALVVGLITYAWLKWRE